MDGEIVKYIYNAILFTYKEKLNYKVCRLIYRTRKTILSVVSHVPKDK